MLAKDAQIQPGSPPDYPWVFWGCSWSFLDCSWLPLAMLARMPKSSHVLLLELPGLLLAARPPPQLPGSCNDPVGLPGYWMPKSSQELFLCCSWNFLGQ